MANQSSKPALTTGEISSYRWNILRFDVYSGLVIGLSHTSTGEPERIEAFLQSTGFIGFGVREERAV